MFTYQETVLHKITGSILTKQWIKYILKYVTERIVTLKTCINMYTISKYMYNFIWKASCRNTIPTMSLPFEKGVFYQTPYRFYIMHFNIFTHAWQCLIIACTLSHLFPNVVYFSELVKINWINWTVYVFEFNDNASFQLAIKCKCRWQCLFDHDQSVVKSFVIAVSKIICGAYSR